MHKLMKMSLMLSFVCLSAFFVSTPAFSKNNQELIFLTWSEYMDPDLVSEFEKKYDVKVKMVYFETDDMRDDLLVQTEGRGYDLILSSGVSIEKYKKYGWLGKITQANVSNIKHIDKKWYDLFESSKNFSVPYFWGTTGIGYRKDLLKGEVTSWKSLFEPAEHLHGKILMVKNSQDSIGMALKMLGYSANSENVDEIKLAGSVLKKQKPFVSDYSYVNVDKSSALVTGDTVITMIYNGDALALNELDSNIEYVLPEEGGNIWADYLLLSKYSKNKALAYQFLNFINEPLNAVRLAEYVYYATPNKAAEKLLPAEFLQNPVIYPSKKSLAKSEVYRSLSPRAVKLRNQMFSNILVQ